MISHPDLCDWGHLLEIAPLIAGAIAKREDDAQEIAAIAISKLTMAIARGEKIENLKAFLCRIVVNTARDYYRARARSRRRYLSQEDEIGEFVESGPTPEQRLLDNERQRETNELQQLLIRNVGALAGKEEAHQLIPCIYTRLLGVKTPKAAETLLPLKLDESYSLVRREAEEAVWFDSAEPLFSKIEANLPMQFDKALVRGETKASYSADLLRRSTGEIYYSDLVRRAKGTLAEALAKNIQTWNVRIMNRLKKALMGETPDIERFLRRRENVEEIGARFE